MEGKRDDPSKNGRASFFMRATTNAAMEVAVTTTTTTAVATFFITSLHIPLVYCIFGGESFLKFKFILSTFPAYKVYSTIMIRIWYFST